MSSFDRSLKNHSAKILAKMSEMRDSGILTDVSLKVGEQIFKAHRVVLAASSDYFSAMFTAGMKESFDELIELKDSSVTPDSLKVILDALYKSELMITEENVFEVLDAANHLQMENIIEQCSKYLSEELVSAQLKKLDDLQSLQKVLSTAEKHSLFKLREEVFTRIAVAFKNLSEAEKFPDFLSSGQLLSLLQRNDLTAPSETFVFSSVVKWIYHNKEERLSHAAKLFKAVRLGLVDIWVLITELRREELKEDEECCKMLHEALLYNNMPTLLPELPLIKTEPRAPSSVLIAIAPNSSLKYYDVTRKMWQTFGQNIPIREYCFSLVSFENFVFVGSKNKVYRYSIDSNSWDELPEIGESYYKLFVQGEYLYVFGNYSAKRYSFVKKAWQVCAHVKSESYRYSNLDWDWQWAVLDECIYAFKKSETWMYDQSENEWIRKSDKMNDSASCYAFAYKGKLVIAGKDSQSRRDIVEVYCKESDRWSEVKQHHPLPSPFSGVVVDNMVFIRLNNFVFDTGIKVSPNVPSSPNLSKWENVTDLPKGALITYAPLNTNKSIFFDRETYIYM